MTGDRVLASCLVLVIVAVFAMLNWFAPALVALRGVAAMEAMKLSFVVVPAQLGAVPGLRRSSSIGVAVARDARRSAVVALLVGAGAMMSGT